MKNHGFLLGRDISNAWTALKIIANNPLLLTLAVLGVVAAIINKTSKCHR